MATTERLTKSVPVRVKVRRGPQARADARLGLLLAAPAVAVIFLIAFFPLLGTIRDSLFKISLRFANQPRPFIGLENYTTILRNAFAMDLRKLTQFDHGSTPLVTVINFFANLPNIYKNPDDDFRNALWVTGRVTTISVAAELVLGMIIALAINRSFAGRGIVRAAVLVPWALTTVVSATMWAWIYDGLYGVVNDILKRLHIIDNSIIFLAKPSLTIWAMIGAEIWKTTPFMALLLLAGLQLISSDIYEAASIDGANGWQQFWRITLPMMKPTILVALLFRTIDAVRMFDLPRVLTNGGPGNSTKTLVLYNYETLFTRFDFGYGSALAVTTFLIVLVISFIFIKVLGAPTQGGRRGV